MIRRPPKSTRTDTLFPYTTLFRSRRQPGFLTGTNIPPSSAIVTAVLDVLLAAAQGVRNYGLELGQALHLVQDAAAIQVCRELCQTYLREDRKSTRLNSSH